MLVVRDRTFLFTQYRNSFGHGHRRKRRNSASGGASGIENEDLIPNSRKYKRVQEEEEELDEDGHVVIEMTTMPPQWVDVAEEVVYQIEEDIKDIKYLISQLNDLHKKHLLPGFDDKTHEEREINDLTNSITGRFQDCQVKIKNIQVSSTHGQDATVGKNIQISLAAKLQEISGEYRRGQSIYLQKISGRKNASVDVFASSRNNGGGGGLAIDGVRDESRQFDMTLSDGQLELIESNENMIAEREGEISHIHESISELAQVFGRLQEMVIDQGTLLDRIDYNIENTVINTESAAQELTKAEQYQKSSVANKFIIILGVIAAILFIILILKWI
ncbi:Integral membrane protein SED5 [Mycoemilia scoparia]|uniref:Integral membrane protein SED5 n=1 Tax=Mycoemilia scoparia TaxID=417184 RepID=A0A9W8DTL8_9FUNG|nr:Integral membrane protein SED5 [Mycoemilia scoparia]